METEQCGLVILTTTDTIVQLDGHIKVLVARGIVGFVEGTVVGDDVGYVAVLAVAKLGIAIARGASSSRSRCRS